MSEKNKSEEMLDEMGNAVEEENETETQNDIDAENEQNLQEDFSALLNEVEEYKDKLLRLGADFENYKRRMEREQAARMKYAGEPVLKEMLSVTDNLERAVEQGAKQDSDSEHALSALLEGVQLTHRYLLSTLEKFEVTAIESVEQPFDPNIHEAMTMETSDTIPVNHIISEFEKGYYYKDRLLRAAKVIVSSGPK